MGAGGQMNVNSDDKNVLERVPVKKPPFEISDLKKAIPLHCYKRDLLRSLYHLISDLAVIYTLYRLASTCIPLLPTPLKYIAWPIYWFVQGTCFMGAWTVGHDLGHHAFSEYEWLDDTLGFVLHSAFLTPYFSFKYSHRSHHAHTNSMEYDEVWIPKRKADTLYSEVLNNPLGNLFMTFGRLVLSYPMYFAFNIHGRKYDGFVSHFYPQSPLFNDSERKYIWLSDAGLVVALYALYKISLATSFTWLFCIYGVPLLVLNGHFIFFSFVHHTHPSLPHFDSREWDWIRGAMSTVDRDYGIINSIFHNVTCAHVVHHLISNIPHYHLPEATKAIKPILGDYYKYDDTPILKAFWRETKECIFVEPDEGAEDSGVYWWRK
ncbi:delta(12) fatty acid desaturase DES8.11-like [Bidens hawaiensis]|uniref:delta(12) fatty acid desaturase DES8.11-like n=1 Tax=Bidens hawaiensis TaxID=980011 RepID=UPI004049C8BE